MVCKFDQLTSNCFIVYVAASYGRYWHGVHDIHHQDPDVHGLWAHSQAVANMKFTYVVSCQVYGLQKKLGDPSYLNILDLMLR